jgi:hypothetical protein
VAVLNMKEMRDAERERERALLEGLLSLTLILFA